MMTTKKSALGKGLSALIRDVENDEEKNPEVQEAKREIETNKLIPNENQPRKHFDEEKIQALAKSIKENGIIQPIIVVKSGEFYKIVAGERRWRAAKSIGIAKVPVIEENLTEKEIMEISVIENLQREDLNPIDEAEAYKRLIDEFSLTQENISEKVGKSRSAIANSLRLINLDDRVKQYLIDETISEGHGRLLLSLEDKELQYETAKKIIDEGLNVRQTEKLIKNIKNVKPEKKKKEKNIYIRDIEDKLKDRLGTKVNISDNKKKGKIEIEYYSPEDLERILEVFSI